MSLLFPFSQRRIGLLSRGYVTCEPITCDLAQLDVFHIQTYVFEKTFKKSTSKMELKPSPSSAGGDRRTRKGGKRSNRTALSLRTAGRLSAHNPTLLVRAGRSLLAAVVFAVVGRVAVVIDLSEKLRELRSNTLRAILWIQRLEM